jgi:hypothetical protein
MPADELILRQHVMTVCNSCRYCGRCAVFPAMERRRLYMLADLSSREPV